MRKVIEKVQGCEVFIYLDAFRISHLNVEFNVQTTLIFSGKAKAFCDYKISIIDMNFLESAELD